MTPGRNGLWRHPFRGNCTIKLFEQTDRADYVNLSGEKLSWSVGQIQFITIETVSSSLWTGQFGARSPNSIHFAQQSRTATCGRLTTTRRTVSHSKSGLELCKRPDAPPPRLAVDARPGHHRPLCLDSRVQSTFYQSALTNSAMSFQRLFCS